MEQSWKKKFFIIYLGQAFSIIGSTAVQFAIMIYLALETESGVSLSIAAIAGFLPGAILGSYAGVKIDRSRKKTVMIISDAFIALSSLVIMFAFLKSENPSHIIIYLMLFFRGLGTVFHGISMQAAIPLFVPGDQLVKAGGWGQTVNGLGNLIGPVLGALMLHFLDMAAVMAVDILGAIFAIICLLSVKLNDPKKEYNEVEKPNFWNEFRHGVNALKKNKPLFRAVPHYVLVGFLYMPLVPMFPLLIVTHYRGGELEASYMEVAIAVGMILGSIFIGMFNKIEKKLRMFLFSSVIMGFFAVVVGALSPNLYLVALFITFVWGMVVPFFQVPFGAYTQESTPPEDMGRVTSLIYTLCYIGNPLGIAVSGPIADLIGANKLFVVLGILIIINALIGMISVSKPEMEYIKNKEANISISS